MDIVTQLTATNQQKNPALLSKRWEKMRKSPFSFLRGSAAWGHTQLQTLIPSEYWDMSPKVWVCGDAHPDNAGTFRGEDRKLYFDINDFDEAVLASPLWDIGRAGTAAQLINAELPAVLLNAYKEAVQRGNTDAASQIGEPTCIPVQELMQEVQTRKQKEFIAKNTKDGQLQISTGHTFKLTQNQIDYWKHIYTQWTKTHPDITERKILDVVGRIAGNGSLGVERCLILVEGRKNPHIIDIKEAATPVLSALVPQNYNWSCSAERVATCQHQMQHRPIMDLGWTKQQDKSFVLKEWQPMADRIALGKLEKADQVTFVQLWAQLLASSHIRAIGWRGSDNLDQFQAWAGTLDKQKPALLHAIDESTQLTVQAHREFTQVNLPQFASADMQL